MRINEISLTKDLKNRKTELDDLEYLFNKYGWKFLGSGFEASVAEHPKKSYVLKIFKSGSSYQSFVNLSRGLKNIHLPKFLSSIKIVPLAPQFKFLRMEKLDKISKNELYFTYLGEMIYFLESAIRNELVNGFGSFWNQAINEIFLNRYNINVISQDKNEKLNFNQHVWDKISKPNPAWMLAVDQVCKHGKELNLNRIDAHSENLML